MHVFYNRLKVLETKRINNLSKFRSILIVNAAIKLLGKKTWNRPILWHLRSSRKYSFLRSNWIQFLQFSCTIYECTGFFFYCWFLKWNVLFSIETCINFVVTIRQTRFCKQHFCVSKYTAKRELVLMPDVYIWYIYVYVLSLFDGSPFFYIYDTTLEIGNQFQWRGILLSNKSYLFFDHMHVKYIKQNLLKTGVAVFVANRQKKNRLNGRSRLQ